MIICGDFEVHIIGGGCTLMFITGALGLNIAQLVIKRPTISALIPELLTANSLHKNLSQKWAFHVVFHSTNCNHW